MKSKYSLTQQDIFASGQLITINPVLQESPEVRNQYVTYLKKLIRLVGLDRKKYCKAQLSFYQEVLCEQDRQYSVRPTMTNLCGNYVYLLPFDLTAVAGAHLPEMKNGVSDLIARQITADFDLPGAAVPLLKTAFDASKSSRKAWEGLEQYHELDAFRNYLRQVQKNVEFIRKPPYKMLITATMSDGKSTLINALVGKRINLTQNMACTGKIHTIVSKPFEDHAVSEFDHDIVMNASDEDLMEDNGKNQSDQITVGTWFNGHLSGQRLVVFDSPGVNSSEHPEHAKITEKMTESRKYRLLIYILNATQLGTDDNDTYLKLVAERKRKSPVIFVINKIDSLNPDEENIFAIIQRQKDYLIKLGFQKPIICPVSSKAAFLAKESMNGTLTRLKQRELYNLMDRFEEYSLVPYYEKYHYPAAVKSENEAEQLLRNCGFSYLEAMIRYIYKVEGKRNGSSIG